MSAFPVSLEKEAQLAQRMAALGVREADIEETFVRSGGHGGQNVNKTGYVAAQRAEIEKIRRQKRRRSRRAKNRMLADKSHHADKKASRRPVGME